MKTKQILLFPIILLIGIFTAKAQNDNYHPLVHEGKVWSVVFVMGDIWDYHFTTTQMMFFGDTIINDIPYKKMYASTKEYPEFPQDWILQNFIREDEDKKVWYKDKNSSSVEKLYYDFSLEIGDTLPDNLGYAQPYITGIPIIEDITYEIMHNGEERKVWHLSSLCGGFDHEKELWIEGVGSNIGVIFPIGGELIGGFNLLLCVHENEELIYNDNPWGGVCYKSGTNGIHAYDDKINIFPNPAQNMLNIINNENLNINYISLINTFGQIVKRYEPNVTQIDVSDLHTGLYFIKFSTNYGEIIQKVVIEK